ncbi:type IV toxin-antitoxin system AbiEi family antitoxin domain-containing protein [Candidatus Poriferisodalis sp.]|uniref:type IV toxin-antitoxin system AbiEi family antitoxin domain-containing protein n=1 Tax=Candidatus Poriferisodalis sp. TaxID=3101277 RepID=UPI003AF66257
MTSVTKGAWVPVPPEFRDAGAPPPLHYIHPLMRHLRHTYYVGFLSAAAIYGAAHHPSMILQVVASARLRDRQIGGSRISFIQRAATDQRATQQSNTPTGRVTVSTSSTTVLDLADSPGRGGGVSNVATVIGDLLISRLLDIESLPAAAAAFPAAAVQRAGYLLEYMAVETGVETSVADVLDELTLMSSTDWAPLVPGGPGDGARDQRWRIVVNAAVEHDL